jgi:hypothetical protein
MNIKSQQANEAAERPSDRRCRDNAPEADSPASAEQLQRIARMEQLLNEASAAVSALDQAIAGYQAAEAAIAALRRYYEGGQWMEDFQADAEGKLPSTLPRGVLTEDAIYDLLTDQVRLRALFRDLGGPTGPPGIAHCGELLKQLGRNLAKELGLRNGL